MKMGHKLDMPVEAVGKKEKNPTYYPSLHLDSKESKVVPESCCIPGETFHADVVFKVKSVSQDDNEADGMKRRIELDVLEISPEVEEEEDTKKTLGYDRKSDPNYKRTNNKQKVKVKASDLED